MKTIFNLRAFLNFLGRHRLYTAINVFGLSVSLVFVVLLAGYSAYEMSTDRFQANKERVFLLADDRDISAFAPPIGPDLQGRYPEIESYCRVARNWQPIDYQDKKLNASVLMADSTFFNFFSFELKEGDSRNVLRTRSGILLSKSFARTLFGTESPMGKEVKLDGLPVTVEGVFGDFQDSHLRSPDIMIPYFTGMYYWTSSSGEENFINEYYNASFGLYLMVRPGADLAAKTDDILAYFREDYWPYENGKYNEVKLIPLQDAYFEAKAHFGLFRNGNRSLNTIFLSVALLILLFAVINYINLSLAQASFRAPEMGTRRLLGSRRGELFWRLIFESGVLCLLSFGLALLLIPFVQPYFNRMLNTGFSVFDLLSGGNVALMVGAVLLLGVVAGLAPASVISRYRPIDIVRGEFRRQSKMVFSKALIGFQYLITIILLGCTLVMYRQIRYMVTADLGYDTHNLLILEQGMKRSQAEGFRNELARIPGVRQISLAHWTPFDGGNNYSATHNDQPISFQVFAGDSLFFDVLGITVLRDNHNASPEAVWINETALRTMTLPDSTSSYKMEDNTTYSIAGIVKDFNFRDFSQQVGPAVLYRNTNPAQFGYIQRMLVKIDPARLYETREAIEKAYDKYTGGEPFSARFSDEIIQGRYESQQRTMSLLGFFTVIAGLISALGILAMATFFIRQRSLEIAIRKVFGSTRAQVLGLLVGRFVRIVVVAFVVAVPVVWYLMRQWLSTYTYRIPLGWDVFALAGFFALAIATLTVFVQSWQAASANPVDSIKR